jgi:Na+-driven multidrug efflux pump
MEPNREIVIAISFIVAFFIVLLICIFEDRIIAMFSRHIESNKHCVVEDVDVSYISESKKDTISLRKIRL